MTSSPKVTDVQMHIAFKFTYIGDDGFFENLLHSIEKRAPVPVSIFQKGCDYMIRAGGDQDELENLAEYISLRIPDSLFLKNAIIEEYQEEDVYDAFRPSFLLTNIPYCLSCQEDIIETFEVGKGCDVCADVAVSRDKVYFETAYEQLRDRGFVEVEGRVFSLLSRGGSKNILLCDSRDISDQFIITQGELDALMLVEKPSVLLKPKLKFRAEHELKELFYHVFLANDKITLAFASLLKEKGITAVLSDNAPHLDLSVSLDTRLITKGEPQFRFELPADARYSFCDFGGYRAVLDDRGLGLSKEELRDEAHYLHFAAHHSGRDADLFFEPAHGALQSIALEHHLRGKNLCGIYLSREHHSSIFSYSPRIGYTQMAEFKEEMPSSVEGLFDSIAQMDAKAERLVQNYQRQFSTWYEQIKGIHLQGLAGASALTRLWAMAALVIGVTKENDVFKACEALEATALEFSGKSGPRIDYKLSASHEDYSLDLRLAIRSAMSFKLAGVDEYLLCFGFIDSLADFVASQAEISDANIAIEGVALSGSLFSNRQLYMRTFNAISANYPVYINERLSIDNSNVAVGALCLGSE